MVCGWCNVFGRVVNAVRRGKWLRGTFTTTHSVSSSYLRVAQGLRRLPVIHKWASVPNLQSPSPAPSCWRPGEQVVLFAQCNGVKLTSSKTFLRPRWVSAEHSTYLTAFKSFANCSPCFPVIGAWRCLLSFSITAGSSLKSIWVPMAPSIPNSYLKEAAQHTNDKAGNTGAVVTNFRKPLLLRKY